MRILADYTQEELNNIILSMGEPVYRAKQIYSAIYDGKNMHEITNIPKNLKTNLDSLTTGVDIEEKFISKEDGTVKYLFKLYDNNIIEGVVMNYKYGNTICISTQVGCRMNCSFCASGLDGLIRNLTSGEMVGQVVVANRDNNGNAKDRKITNVVLMGSGEPLDNYDNVVRFLKLISSEDGINISPRNISLSTCGLADRMIDLSNEGLPVNLTLSLHAPNDEIRQTIMPINKGHNVKQIISALRTYYKNTGRRVIVEYALINGINDSDSCAEQLSALVRGFPCHINLIKLNYVKEKKYMSSSRAKEFMAILTRNKISATIRRTMGSDIEGACGQLRRRHLD